MDIIWLIVGIAGGFIIGLIARKPREPKDYPDLYLTYGINNEPEFYFAVTPDFIKDVKNKKFVTFNLIHK